MNRSLGGLLRLATLVLGLGVLTIALSKLLGPGAIAVVVAVGALYVAVRWGLLQTDKRLLLALVWAAFMLAITGFGPVAVILFPVVAYLLLRFVTVPLARIIARGGFSIRWKFEVGITVIGIMFMLVSLISHQAMEYMHYGLHEVIKVGETQPDLALAMVNDLERTHHGPFFSLIPVFSLFGVVLAVVLGSSLAWSVIDPVRRMGDGMRRIGEGDFSNSVEVDNRDELGELAEGINQSAENIERLQEALLAEERNRALLERMTHVAQTQEEERRRIAGELHDGLGPSLAGLGNRLRACKYLLQQDVEAAGRELDEVVGHLKGHIQEIRNLSYDLRPIALEQSGLVGAIRQRLEWFESGTGVRTSFSGPESVELSPLAEVTVFRIVQESLNNIQKYAEARNVEVQVRETAGELEVRVRDDGKGFDPAGLAAERQGMGLRNMRDRAKGIGGNVTVSSSPGAGCEIVLSVPKEEVPVGAGAHTRLVGG